MADASGPVQEAIFVKLSDALAVPVYDHVPHAAPAPYVTIGDDTAVDASAKDIGSQEITVTIHTWDDTHRGRKGVKDLQSQIYDALHDLPLEVAGVTIAYIWWEFATSFLDADMLTYHGVQRFRIRTLG
jgi:hypothetical protein